MIDCIVYSYARISTVLPHIRLGKSMNCLDEVDTAEWEHIRESPTRAGTLSPRSCYPRLMVRGPGGADDGAQYNADALPGLQPIDAKSKQRDGNFSSGRLAGSQADMW